ncbi:kinase-like domain-containing protein [Chytridium lagenaria]|nr:kinase-like domain-containing protein [Chytridium lagenaria]
MGCACCKQEKIDYSNEEVELTHFNLLRSVGKGAFGKVRVVQHKGTQKIYALKYINKAKCIKMKAVENIIQERRLLEEVHNMRFAFQDDENLFMVIDLMLGGDLRFHLDRMGSFTEDMVRFYTAEITLGLAYLHSKKIVHRDLSRITGLTFFFSVLLDEFGHASLTDFNIALLKYLERRGTLNAVDWWSLGIVAYELLYGRRPFRSKTNEGLTVSIMSDDLHFPNEPPGISTEARQCLRAFITRDTAERLGSKETGGDTKVREHAWFKSIDWGKLGTERDYTTSKKANFDATHELEELLLEDNPLKAKPRKKDADGVLTPRHPETTKAMAIMEEKFIVYDYTRPRPARTSNLKINQMDAKSTSVRAMPVDIKTTAVDEEEMEVVGESCSLHVDPMEGRTDGIVVDGMVDDTSPTKSSPPVVD